jgi:hypothetical protein
MAANEEQRRRMLAMLLRIPPKNALQQQPAQQPSNWLSKPLPMEGRFGLLPIKEEVPGMGPSLFNKRSAALPGLLAGAVNAFTAPGRALRGGMPEPEKEGVEFGLNVMGGGLLGSRAAPLPRGAIGMNASPRWYHGTNAKIAGPDEHMRSLHFTDSAGNAKFWGENVYEGVLAPGAKTKTIKAPKGVDPVEYWDNIVGPGVFDGNDAIVVTSEGFPSMMVVGNQSKLKSVTPNK